jgi:hypothetical protein
MSPRSRRPGGNPALIAYVGLFLTVAVMCVVAATAHASYYRMVLCSADNGSNSYQTQTNTASSQNPNGIFSFENHCGPAPYPAGNSAFLRIAENQASGNAGVNAYGAISWTTTPWVDIVAGGGYTREPDVFNDGWRGRFWLEDWGGNGQHVLVQGAGVENGSCEGVCWATTSTFAPHLWPFAGYGKYRRFVFELTCFRAAGCDRTNFNAVDANSMVLILKDTAPPAIDLHDDSGALLSGKWVRGDQPVSWATADEGSGLRYEWLRVDGAERAVVDRTGQCNIGSNPATGEFARDFVPCPRGGWFDHATSLDTAGLSDGAHSLQACVQDYAGSVGLSGTSGQVCDGRTIHTDNTPPGAPVGLSIITPNPHRYVSAVGASWNLPTDPGSPVTKVHYSITDSSGETVVVQEKVATGVNPKKVDNIGAPAAPGDFRLRVWLEDEVGLIGQPAVVPIPRDTDAPAAPEDISVTAPKTPRSSEGFDVAWRNVGDAGAPINAARYQILDGKDEVVVPTHDVVGDNPQSIANLATPREPGAYTLRLWITDAEGNASQPVKAPLAFDCLRSEVAGGQSLTAGLGKKTEDSLAVHQGQGARLSGRLSGKDDGLGEAPLCVFSRIVTKQHRRFLGIAVTGHDGRFTFAVEPGPSRDLIAVYRPDHRELRARATLRTKVSPTLRLLNGTVHNRGRPAVFKGRIPGPNAAGVTVLLQVEDGKGWRVYRQGLTGNHGRFVMHYPFRQTFSATTYTMRAKVNKQRGYAYEPGSSKKIKVPVLP